MKQINFTNSLRRPVFLCYLYIMDGKNLYFTVIPALGAALLFTHCSSLPKIGRLILEKVIQITVHITVVIGYSFM